jgi:hypothetical protein
VTAPDTLVREVLTSKCRYAADRCADAWPSLASAVGFEHPTGGRRANSFRDPAEVLGSSEKEG